MHLGLCEDSLGLGLLVDAVLCRKNVEVEHEIGVQFSEEGCLAPPHFPFYQFRQHPGPSEATDSHQPRIKYQLSGGQDRGRPEKTPRKEDGGRDDKEGRNCDNNGGSPGDGFPLLKRLKLRRRHELCSVKQSTGSPPSEQTDKQSGLPRGLVIFGHADLLLLFDSISLYINFNATHQ